MAFLFLSLYLSRIERRLVSQHSDSCFVSNELSWLGRYHTALGNTKAFCLTIHGPYFSIYLHLHIRGYT